MPRLNFIVHCSIEVEATPDNYPWNHRMSYMIQLVYYTCHHYPLIIKNPYIRLEVHVCGDQASSETGPNL